ncbi:LysR family transcriptional regulator [Polyangium aurulentum]|uniref:LysR family transcriptional regulator n=1 Tax=Polyangium aurulentum TaxID=2567896 RepID=UPI0010AEADE5|nr:LysR family transcriptional regulator [Polyangium aurulentum]UQA58606.1 LysR family transcriptional regulator [Polyangium aurulentum]
MVDLNEILVFTSVVREGSFTRAAKKLGLPKSTASERVSSLETRLGVKLLERSTRSLELTPVGSAYYEQCAQIIAAAEEADASASEATGVPRGRLRIGCSSIIAELILGRVATQFSAKYPLVDIELVISDGPPDMNAPQFDVWVQTRGSVGPNMIAHRIGKAIRVCYASPKYLAARGAPKSVRALGEHSWIVVGRHPEQTLSFTSRGQVDHLAIRGRFVVNSLHIAADAAAAGAGLVMLPSFVVADRVRAGELVPVLESWKVDINDINVVYAATQKSILRLRLFVEMLLAQARSGMPWNIADESGD